MLHWVKSHYISIYITSKDTRASRGTLLGVEEGDLIQIHKEVGRRHGGGPQDGSKP